MWSWYINQCLCSREDWSTRETGAISTLYPFTRSAAPQPLGVCVLKRHVMACAHVHIPLWVAQLALKCQWCKIPGRSAWIWTLLCNLVLCLWQTLAEEWVQMSAWKIPGKAGKMPFSIEKNAPNMLSINLSYFVISLIETLKLKRYDFSVVPVTRLVGLTPPPSLWNWIKKQSFLSRFSSYMLFSSLTLNTQTLQALIACPPMYHLMKSIPLHTETQRPCTSTPMIDNL